MPENIRLGKKSLPENAAQYSFIIRADQTEKSFMTLTPDCNCLGRLDQSEIFGLSSLQRRSSRSSEQRPGPKVAEEDERSEDPRDCIHFMALAAYQGTEICQKILGQFV